MAAVFLVPPAPIKTRPCINGGGFYYARMNTPKSLSDVAAATSHALSVETPGSSNFKKAERLNAELLKICERAIEQASEAPPAIRDWRDLKTAREIMAAASGTDTAKPLVNLIFPPALDGQSSEAQGYVRISDITHAKAHGQTAPAIPEPFEALPAVALHAIAAHERTLGTTGGGGRGQTASA